METEFLKQLVHLVQGEVSNDKRVPRDSGYGGGGCGGFEVFAFLAFLLALLNLVLQLNDNNRRRRSVLEEAEACRDSLDLSEGVWAVSQLTEGVLRAIASPPSCSHALLCDAASSAASRGPLAATFTALARLVAFTYQCTAERISVTKWCPFSHEPAIDVQDTTFNNRLARAMARSAGKRLRPSRSPGRTRARLQSLRQNRLCERATS